MTITMPPMRSIMFVLSPPRPVLAGLAAGVVPVALCKADVPTVVPIVRREVRALSQALLVDVHA